jgi:hypothetical protein
MSCIVYRWTRERNEELAALYAKADTVHEVVERLKELHPGERFNYGLVRKQANLIGSRLERRYKTRNKEERGVHIRIPHDSYARIKDEAKRRRLSISNLVTTILQNVERDSLFNAVLEEEADHGHAEA